MKYLGEKTCSNAALSTRNSTSSSAAHVRTFAVGNLGLTTWPVSRPWPRWLLRIRYIVCGVPCYGVAQTQHLPGVYKYAVDKESLNVQWTAEQNVICKWIWGWGIYVPKMYNLYLSALEGIREKNLKRGSMEPYIAMTIGRWDKNMNYRLCVKAWTLVSSKS